MRILPAHVIPIFLGGAGPTPGGGPCGSQISYFDVYYVTPPVVGFSVIACECDCECSSGEHPCDSP